MLHKSHEAFWGAVQLPWLTKWIAVVKRLRTAAFKEWLHITTGLTSCSLFLLYRHVSVPELLSKIVYVRLLLMYLYLLAF